MSRVDRVVLLLYRLDRLSRRYWPAVLVAEIFAVLSLGGVQATTDIDDSSEGPEESRQDELESVPPKRVSVLMPAWNEGNAIQSAIEGFLSVTYTDAELIVCAGGSDGTYEHARSLANENVVVIEQSDAMNKQAALNACLAEASGEVYYLVDGDCILETETWYATLRPILREEEHVVTGVSRPRDDLWGRWLPTYQYVKEEFERARRPPYANGILGRNVALSDEAMSTLDSFNESIQAGTDYNLAKRLLDEGFDIRFAPESRIQSEYPTTISGYFSQQSRWLRNVVFLGRKWGALDEVKSVVLTCVIGVAMAVAPVVGLLFAPVLFGWAGLLIYGLQNRYQWATEFNASHDTSVDVLWFCLVSIAGQFLEFATWNYAVWEMLVPERRRRW